jgi:hypothetical protein
MSNGNTHYLSDAMSLEDLFKRMTSPDREECAAYQNMKVEQCFINRIFAVYRPTGLTDDNTHRPPEVLGQVMVSSFVATEQGVDVTLEDLTTRRVMVVGYIPRRLFDYDAFVSIPPRQRLHWDAQSVRGVIKRSLGFQLLFKVRTKADFYSSGVTGVETPSSFRALFPESNLTLINNK